MGGGTSNVKKGGNAMRGGNKSGALTQQKLNDVADQYQATADNYARLMNRNPNNLLYSEQFANYTDLAGAARRMDASKTEFDGIEAVVAMSNPKIGDTVEITGTIFDGTYKYQYAQTAFGVGNIWLQQNARRPHSFVANPDTVASELDMIRGGRLKVRPSQAKVRFK